MRYPSKDKPFFLYDPEGEGMTFYATAEERDAAAKEVINLFLDGDGWSPEVENVVAGELTLFATEVDRVGRPSDLDEDGNDVNGDYWPPDCEWLCRYEMRPLT